VFLEGFEALDPPESIAKVHRLLGEAFVRLTLAAEGLAASAGIASTIEEAEQTPEVAECHASNADGVRICLDVQEKLDDLTASGESLDDVPWISGLGLVVKAALCCGEIETGWAAERVPSFSRTSSIPLHGLIHAVNHHGPNPSISSHMAGVSDV
jgi:hypothetical protein